jgi:hypothetical protein
MINSATAGTYSKRQQCRGVESLQTNWLTLQFCRLIQGYYCLGRFLHPIGPLLPCL